MLPLLSSILISKHIYGFLHIYVFNKQTFFDVQVSGKTKPFDAWRYSVWYILPVTFPKPNTAYRSAISESFLIHSQLEALA